MDQKSKNSTDRNTEWWNIWKPDAMMITNGLLLTVHWSRGWFRIEFQYSQCRASNCSRHWRLGSRFSVYHALSCFYRKKRKCHWEKRQNPAGFVIHIDCFRLISNPWALTLHHNWTLRAWDCIFIALCIYSRIVLNVMSPTQERVIH